MVDFIQFWDNVTEFSPEKTCTLVQANFLVLYPLYSWFSPGNLKTSWFTVVTSFYSDGSSLERRGAEASRRLEALDLRMSGVQGGELRSYRESYDHIMVIIGNHNGDIQPLFPFISYISPPFRKIPSLMGYYRALYYLGLTV
jgi:hypothetical protein